MRKKNKNYLCSFLFIFIFSCNQENSQKKLEDATWPFKENNYPNLYSFPSSNAKMDEVIAYEKKRGSIRNINYINVSYDLDFGPFRNYRNWGPIFLFNYYDTLNYIHTISVYKFVKYDGGDSTQLSEAVIKCLYFNVKKSDSFGYDVYKRNIAYIYKEWKNDAEKYYERTNIGAELTKESLKKAPQFVNYRGYGFEHNSVVNEDPYFFISIDIGLLKLPKYALGISNIVDDTFDFYIEKRYEPNPFYGSKYEK